jgi:hypothetical protein
MLAMLAPHKGRNVMRQVGVLVATTVLLLILGVSLSAGAAVAQQNSLKEQLVGTWKLVSAENVRNDGSKRDVSGANPRKASLSTRATDTLLS